MTFNVNNWYKILQLIHEYIQCLCKSRMQLTNCRLARPGLNIHACYDCMIIYLSVECLMKDPTFRSQENP